MTDSTIDPYSASTESMYDVALELFRSGHKIFPITADGRKIPLVRFTSENGENQVATSPADVYSYWVENYPSASIGVVTGPRTEEGSGLLVIDVDVKNGSPGPASLTAAEAKLGGLPVTLRVTSPSGGYHLVYQYPDDSDLWRNWNGWRPGIDIRGYHGFVAAPGSVDVRGTYVGSGASVAELPTAWLEALLKPVTDLSVRPDFTAVETDEVQHRVALEEMSVLADRIRFWSGPGKHGNLNRVLPIVGSWLHHLALVEQEQALGLMVTALGQSHAADGTIDQFQERKALKTVTTLTNYGRVNPKWHKPAGTTLGNIADWGMPIPLPKALTDLGNADRMAAMFAGQYKHVSELKLPWFTYDGHRWVKDKRQSVMVACREMVTRIALEGNDDDTRKWAKSSQSRSAMNAAVGLFASDPAIAATTEDFDAALPLVSFTNGTLNLDTLTLQEPVPEDMITKSTGYDYDSGAVCPVWDSFIAQMVPDPTDRTFLQRAVGYSLTGKNNARAMFVLFGRAGTGKSKFIDGIRYAFGEYADVAATEALMKKIGGGISNDVKDMEGYRFITVSESDHDQALNESLIKQITGGDEVHARQLYSNNSTFKPTGVIWLGTNNKPQIKGDDGAIWTRIYPVKFDVVIPLDQQDLGLPEKLRAERAGIMNWALRGLVSFNSIGLAPTQRVLDLVEEYKDEQDPVRIFLRERTYADTTAMVAFRVLYEDWVQWNRLNGTEHFLTQKRFGNRLTALGFEANQGRDKYVHAGCLDASQPEGCLSSHQVIRVRVGLDLTVRQHIDSKNVTLHGLS